MNVSELGSSSGTKQYTRGPYRSSTRKNESSKDCVAIRNYLLKVRAELKEQFKLSYNRSKCLENIQGLIDYLTKQVKKEESKPKSIDPLERIMNLELRIKELESRIQSSELDQLINNLSSE